MKTSRIAVAFAFLLFTLQGAAGQDREGSTAASPASVGKAGLAVIYNGTTAAAGGPEAIAAIAQRAGMGVKYFSRVAELPSLLKEARICVIGGTEDDLQPFIREFTAPVRTALVDWVKAGGRYLGICGGGYMASTGWEEKDRFEKALALIPVESEAWVEEADPRIVTVTWNGARRPIYYQYGPAFLAKPDSGAEVLSRYEDGKIAALIMPVGKGAVLVWGPHPEADASWLDDDPEPVDAASWKPTDDIGLAMFTRLLK